MSSLKWLLKYIYILSQFCKRKARIFAFHMSPAELFILSPALHFGSHEYKIRSGLCLQSSPHIGYSAPGYKGFYFFIFTAYIYRENQDDSISHLKISRKSSRFIWTSNLTSSSWSQNLLRLFLYLCSTETSKIKVCELEETEDEGICRGGVSAHVSSAAGTRPLIPEPQPFAPRGQKVASRVCWYCKKLCLLYGIWRGGGVCFWEKTPL